MSAKLKELREKRGAVRKRLQELGDKLKAEGRAMSAEETEAFNKMKEDFGALTTQLQAVQADIQAIDALIAQGVAEPTETPPPADPAAPPPSENSGRRKPAGEGRQQVSAEVRALALQAWLRNSNGLKLRADHVKACERAGVNPRSKEFFVRLGRRPDRRSLLRRDMGVNGGSAGGYTVAPEFMTALEIALLQYGGVRQVADVIRTETGAEMPWPTLDDTSNEGELLGENTAVGEQDAAVGKVVFGAYKFSSKLIPVSYELLNDSAVITAETVNAIAGERLGRIQNRKFTVGTGSNEPRGIVTAATSGRSATSATAISVDDLIYLKHSIDPAYRVDPSCGWMMHDNVLAAITMLKDAENRPIFVESYRDGEPDRILNKPVVINQSMDSTIAATKKTVLFGALGKFKIRDVGEIRFRRLDERYADQDQTGFIAFMRSDSRLLNAGTNPVKYLLH